MPRRQGPPDAMTATYGGKSEHIRVRITTHELDLMTRAVTHGGFESQSQFIRSAIVAMAEKTLAGPTAVERQIFAQREIESVQPELVQAVDPHVTGLAVPMPVESPPVPLEAPQDDQPTLDQLLRSGALGGTPVEAPLDFDDGGWVG